MRPGRDAVTRILKEYVDRLNIGLGWIVDTMEWIDCGEHLGNEKINHDFDPYAFLAEHPLMDVVLDQFFSRGKPSEVYLGSAGISEFTFKVAEGTFGADSLVSMEARGEKTTITRIGVDIDISPR